MFFDGQIPKTSSDAKLAVIRHDTWLHKLNDRCGGPIRRKEYPHLEEKIPISHFADSMVYPQGVLTKTSRDQIIQYAEQNASNVRIVKGEKTRKNKKRVAIAAPTDAPVTEGAVIAQRKRGRTSTKQIKV